MDAKNISTYFLIVKSFFQQELPCNSCRVCFLYILYLVLGLPMEWNGEWKLTRVPATRTRPRTRRRPGTGDGKQQAMQLSKS